MSNIRKISNEVVKYVIDRKKRNPELSCRKLSLEASEMYKYNISKSSINNIILDNRLSSPVGRRISKYQVLSQEASGCGYAFLLGANYKLGLSSIVARSLRMAHPIVGLSKASIETLSLAWIMSRAFYNVALDRIANYSKNEIWPLIGRKAARGQLQRYLEMFKMMQTVNNNIVTELSSALQDILCLKMTLKNGSMFYLDGQGRTVWREKNMPLNFSVTLNESNSYINDVIFGNEPMVLFSARPEQNLGEEFLDFIFCFDGFIHENQVEKIDLLNIKGVVIKEVINFMPMRRKLIVGVWPWQHKSIVESASKTPQGIFFLEALGLKFPYFESTIKLAQPIGNKEIKLRSIVITDPGSHVARIALWTNIHPDEMKADDVVSVYVRRHHDFEAGHKVLTSAAKEAVYADDYITAQKILFGAKDILACRTPDEIFSILVDILNNFSKKCFFPQACSGWSLLKMREIFYKRSGLIKRDMASDVIFNIFNSNKLQEIDKLDNAALRFNDSCIFEPSGKRFWLSLS
jgi:hypothetical protein